jgi:hypothetical protein
MDIFRIIYLHLLIYSAKFNESSKKKKNKKEEDIETQYEQTRLNEVIEEQEQQQKEEKSKAKELLEKNPNADVRKIRFALPVKNKHGVLVPQVQHIDQNEPKVPTLSAAEKKKKRKREKKPEGEEEPVVSDDEPVVSDDDEVEEKDERELKRQKASNESKEERASLQKILADPVLRAKRLSLKKEEIAVLSTDVLTEPVGKVITIFFQITITLA